VERSSLEELERRFNHYTMKKTVQRAMGDLDDVEVLSCNFSMPVTARFTRAIGCS
jgi:hypothetical protein